MQQWDGTKWVKSPTGSSPMKDKVRPHARSGGQEYVEQEHRLAEAHRGLRQVARKTSARHEQTSPADRTRERFAIRRRSLHVSAVDARRSPHPLRRSEPHPFGQQHRGDLRSRHPGAEGRVARRAEGRHRGAARRQRRRQDHHAEGDLQPAARRAWRGHQGLDRCSTAPKSRISRRTSLCGAAASR